MSAKILTFPGALCCLPVAAAVALPAKPAISASALARKFEGHFLPVVQASVDLLEADEEDFEARCRCMLDADGTTMIDELCAELKIVGGQMQILVDGLELTRARLRTAIVRCCAGSSSERL